MTTPAAPRCTRRSHPSFPKRGLLIWSSVKVDDSGRRRFSLGDFYEIRAKESTLRVPELVAFFSDDPANVRTDYGKIFLPVVFVRFMDEPPHGNSGHPHNNVKDSRIREDQTGFVFSGVDIRFQARCSFNKRRHPEILIVNCFGIKKISCEFPAGRFQAGGGYRIRE